MPTINGKFVKFDPAVLAKAVAEGKMIAPDTFDWESDVKHEERINNEGRMINQFLRDNHPEIWHKINFPEIPEPQKSWQKERPLIAKSNLMLLPKI